MTDVNKSLQFGWNDHAKFLRGTLNPVQNFLIDNLCVYTPRSDGPIIA